MTCRVCRKLKVGSSPIPDSRIPELKENALGVWVDRIYRSNVVDARADVRIVSASH